MILEVYNLSNAKVGEVEVSDSVFGADVKPCLFHEVVKMQLANRRRGTHQGKNRSMVSGGGKKPYRQKGTGNARQGCRRSPNFVGGGWVFAKVNRDYSYKLNKKKMRAALCSALSMAVREGKVKVVENFELSDIKTKTAREILKTLEMPKALVIDGVVSAEEALVTMNNVNLRLSIRNLPTYKYLRPEGVNVYDILHYGSVVVTRDGLKRLEERLMR